MKHLKVKQDNIVFSKESLWEDITKLFKGDKKDEKDKFDYYNLDLIKEYFNKIDTTKKDFRSGYVEINSQSHVLSPIIIDKKIPPDLIRRLRTTINSFKMIIDLSGDKSYSNLLNKTYQELIKLSTEQEVKQYFDKNKKLLESTPFSKVKNVQLFKFSLINLSSFGKAWGDPKEVYLKGYVKIDSNFELKSCDFPTFKDIKNCIIELIALYEKCVSVQKDLFLEDTDNVKGIGLNKLLDSDDYEHELFNYLFDYNNRNEYPYTTTYCLDVISIYIRALCYYVRNSLEKPQSL